MAVHRNEATKWEFSSLGEALRKMIGHYNLEIASIYFLAASNLVGAMVQWPPCFGPSPAAHPPAPALLKPIEICPQLRIAPNLRRSNPSSLTMAGAA